jgi:NAD(P)-dependent dehydrogenase (short-subunit alcohol dehydrogenase family)
VGRGIALALAAEGATVVVCGRTREPLDETCALIAVRGDRAAARTADVGDLPSLEALVADVVAAYGTVDILVNNAMQIPGGTLLEISEETVDAGWRTGPLAALRLMRLCHPHLRGGGVVVNVSSGTSTRPDSPAMGVYGATKVALNALSRSAAVEWAADGIRVNTIFPVAMTPAMERFTVEQPERAAQLVAGVPMGRIGDAEADVGRAVVFLCSDDASYITGTTLPVDGGRIFLR